VFASAAKAGEKARMGRYRVLAALCIAFGAVGLGTALGSERFGGLVPCALCLLERWPYRILIVLGAVALLPGTWLRRATLWAAVLCLFVSVVLAATHVGVEQGWWPSPLPECAAPDLGGGTIAERLARMPLRPSKPCDSPTYLIPGLPLSMAAMNGLACLLFGAFLLAALRPQLSSSSESQYR
jgi:disulfide bond formation protein DsbB